MKITKAELQKEWNQVYGSIHEISHDAFHVWNETNDERFKKVWNEITRILFSIPVIRTKDRKAEIQQKVDEMYQLWDKANKLLHNALDEYYVELSRKQA